VWVAGIKMPRGKTMIAIKCLSKSLAIADDCKSKISLP